MTPTDPWMLREAREAPTVASRLLARNAERVRDLARAVRKRSPRFALTVARGSSDHAASFVKYALETQLGLPVASLAPSVATVYGRAPDLSGALVVGISQSGASPDIVEPVEIARRQGAITVALVNRTDSPLAAAAEVVLPLHAREERAVAATKSYVASLVGALQLVAALGEDAAFGQALAELPGALQRTLEVEPTARARAERFRFVSSLVVLGRGLHLGVAQETALKLVETSGVVAQAYSAAEFAHGPMRLIGPGFPVVAFQAADDTAPLTLHAYRQLRARGAELVLIGADAPVDAPVKLVTPRTGHRLTDPVPTVLAAYFLAGHVALARDQDPDAPPALQKITRTR